MHFPLPNYMVLYNKEIAAASSLWVLCLWGSRAAEAWAIRPTNTALHQLSCCFPVAMVWNHLSAPGPLPPSPTLTKTVAELRQHGHQWRANRLCSASGFARWRERQCVQPVSLRLIGRSKKSGSQSKMQNKPCLGVLAQEHGF